MQGGENYAGTFLSSLDMAGISISLLAVDDERLRWLDAITTAPAWPNVLNRRPSQTKHYSPEVGNPKLSIKQGALTARGVRIKRIIEAACGALIDAERELTELDRMTGDGDLGTNMKRAAEVVLVSTDTYPLEDVPATLMALAHTLRRELGGSSGPLYGVLFLRCGVVLSESEEVGLAQWARALDQGCRSISELGGANPGDRTMLDALDPFAQSLACAEDPVSRDVLLTAVESAERGAEDTARMRARLGRSSYLGDRVLGYPDPGAKAAAIWLRAVYESLLPELLP